jgi:hypothetical protein
MQLRIDYDFEIAQDEKLKIKWVFDEFEVQFSDITEHFTEEDIIHGLEFIDYIISIVESDNPEVLSFLRSNLERLEKRYPIFFK